MTIKLEDRRLWAITFWAIAGLTLIFQIVLVAIGLRLAIVDLTSTSIHKFAIAASVLNLISLVVLIIAISFRLRSNSLPFLRIFHLAATLLFLAAHTLALYCLGWTREHSGLARNDKSQSVFQTATAGLAICVLALVGQSLFFAFCSVSRQARPRTSSESDGYTTDRSSPARSAKRVIAMRLASLSPPSQPPLDPPVSSRFSVYSNSPATSIRNSIHNAIRPMTSKTRLLMRHSFTTPDNRSMPSIQRPSVDMVREDDGFQTWDTSAVEDVETGLYKQPQGKKSDNRLATIPGSRPVSPAKALDGPFPLPLKTKATLPEQIPLPESPIQPSPSPTESDVFQPFPPPGFGTRRPSTPQSNIHPLFRSESPVPPPLASPGTVITASPFAGQVVPADHPFGLRRLHSAHSAQELRSVGSATSLGKAVSVRSFGVQSAVDLTEPVPPMPNLPG